MTIDLNLAGYRGVLVYMTFGCQFDCPVVASLTSHAYSELRLKCIFDLMVDFLLFAWKCCTDPSPQDDCYLVVLQGSMEMRSRLSYAEVQI